MDHCRTAHDNPHEHGATIDYKTSNAVETLAGFATPNPGSDHDNNGWSAHRAMVHGALVLWHQHRGSNCPSYDENWHSGLVHQD